MSSSARHRRVCKCSPLGIVTTPVSHARCYRRVTRHATSVLFGLEVGILWRPPAHSHNTGTWPHRADSQINIERQPGNGTCVYLGNFMLAGVSWMCQHKRATKQFALRLLKSRSGGVRSTQMEPRGGILPSGRSLMENAAVRRTVSLFTTAKGERFSN